MERLALTSVGSIIQSIRDLKGTERQWRGEFLYLLGLGHPSSLALEHHSIRFLGLQTLGLTLLAPLAFRVRLNCATGFPSCPPYRWQAVGLFGIHNCMSQFL